MKTLLTLNRLRVQHANAMVSWNVVGAPAITAHLGFARALGLAWSLNATGVAILHHGMDHEGNYSKYNVLSPNRVRGVPIQTEEKDRSKFALADQPFALSHYEVSLVIELEGEEEDIAAFRDDVLAEHKFKQSLMANMRFAGGSIVSVRDVMLSDFHKEALGKLSRTGHFVLDVSQELLPTHEGEDQLDRAIALLYPLAQEVEGEQDEDAQSKKRWLALSNLGFIRVSDVAHRVGARFGLPHAYAEPLLGLVEYVPLRRVIQKTDTPLFWRFTYPAEDVIAASTLS